MNGIRPILQAENPPIFLTRDSVRIDRHGQRRRSRLVFLLSSRTAILAAVNVRPDSP